MKDLKDVIAENLTRLRQEAGLTQLQLAEILNYSDKAVSKWERGESTPDIRVLAQLASIYHIKVDDIITEQTGKAVKPKINRNKKRIVITLLSVGLVWFVATFIFAVLFFLSSLESYAYLVFIVAPFVSAIVLVVFSAIWGNGLTSVFASSLLVWSLVAIFHVFFAEFCPLTDKYYLFYVIAAPFQVLIILWFVLKKLNFGRKKPEKSDE